MIASTTTSELVSKTVAEAESFLRSSFGAGFLADGAAGEGILLADGAPLDWASFAAIGTRLSAIYRGSARVDRVFIEHAKGYAFPLAFSEWGQRDAKNVVMCLGGIVNTSQRFDVLGGVFAQQGMRVISVDWPGRGASGWLREQEDYALEDEVDHIIRLIRALNLPPLVLVGSSRGAMVALRLAALAPDLLRAVVLNDTGPILPRARRQKRAAVLGRHYVFADPSDLFYRIGAMQKNDGPTPESFRYHLAHAQTHLVSHEQGRIYRHDIRPLLQYRAEAQQGIDFCTEFAEMPCSLLVIRGIESDVLTVPIESVARKLAPPHTGWVTVAATGHTPTCVGPRLLEVIHAFIDNPEAWFGLTEHVVESPQPGWLFRRH